MSAHVACVLVFSAVSPPQQLGGLSVSVAGAGARASSGPRSPSSPGSGGPFYENKDVMAMQPPVGSPSSPSSQGDERHSSAAVRFAHSDSVESNTDHGDQHSRDVRFLLPFITSLL